VAGQSRLIERRQRAVDAMDGQPSRFLESVHRGVGGLSGSRILSRRLPELRRGAFHVQNVVHDLKRETQLRSTAVDCREELGGRADHDGAGQRRRSDEGPGLALVHRAQSLRIERMGARSRGLKIERLPSRHASSACGVTDRCNCVELAGGEHLGANASGACTRLAGHQSERFSVQGIAGEDRLSLSEHDVRRRPSTTKRVIVHRGQIVVDERIGVNQFQRTGGRQRELPRFCLRYARPSGDRFG
jgi:hypothetical protein